MEVPNAEWIVRFFLFVLILKNFSWNHALGIKIHCHFTEFLATFCKFFLQKERATLARLNSSQSQIQLYSLILLIVVHFVVFSITYVVMFQKCFLGFWCMAHGPIGDALQGRRKVWRTRGIVCSNGFYADISNQRQMQQYKSYLQSFL